MAKVIGIDLGTTNSCVAVVEGGEAIIVPSNTGARTTPSVVAFSKNGERLIGEVAKRQLTTNAERTISSVKRHMGTDWFVNIDGKDYKAQTISAMVLMKLKKDAEDFTGASVTDAVITVPAYFNDVQRQATKDAGKIAGLNVLRIINEPTSAALSYGLNHGESQKVMVYDLGGGTFDVSVIEIADGVIEVLATAGDNHLGGDDFDARIVDWIVREFKAQHRVDLSKDVTAIHRVEEAAEKAKKELSTAERTNINLPYLVQVKGEPIHLDITLTRVKFQELVHDLVERTVIPVQNALQDAGIAPSELGKVLLVGGSTRIPIVQAKVKELTGREPSRNINPDECVAMGAAILGSTLSGNALVSASAGKDLLLLDVTPMSLSIETVGGVATRLIERNTTLPTRYSRVFSTAAPYQREVEIRVLQGERPMAKDNKKIGNFKLKGIRKAMAGVPQIEVTFDIDANGILKVSAKDLDTGKEQSITIQNSGNMSKEDIEKAAREAEEHAEEDKKKREAIDAKNKLENAIYQAEKMPSEYKDKISDDDKKTIEDAVKSAKEVLGKEDADKDELEKAAQELSDKIMPIGAKMYQQAGADKSAETDTKKSDSDSDEPVEGEVVDK